MGALEQLPLSYVMKKEFRFPLFSRLVTTASKIVYNSSLSSLVFVYNDRVFFEDCVKPMLIKHCRTQYHYQCDMFGVVSIYISIPQVLRMITHDYSPTRVGANWEYKFQPNTQPYEKS